MIGAGAFIISVRFQDQLVAVAFRNGKRLIVIAVAQDDPETVMDPDILVGRGRCEQAEGG